MKRKIVAGLVVGVVVLSVIAAGILARSSPVSHPVKGDIGVININGMITTGGSASGLLGSATVGSEDLNRQLRNAAEDDRLKAVVIRMNSPGGTVAGTQSIAKEVERLRQSGTKVVASMGDVAASGAYWIASSCDQIVANPAALTGSIGVIMNLQNTEELYDKLGIEQRVLKKGEHKDMGSTHRDMTEDEREIFQSMLDEHYNQFVNAVAEGRNMEREEVTEYATGRVFTGSQAHKAGLVDKTGNFYDAVDLAAELAGIEGEPNIVRLEPERNWWDLVQSNGSAPLDGSNLKFLLEHSPFALVDFPQNWQAEVNTNG